MSFTVMKCPVCGAPLRIGQNTNYIVCDACDTPLMMSEEHRLFRADEAEEFGYRFEKGRQRAQSEQAGRQNFRQEETYREGESRGSYYQQSYSYVQPDMYVSDKDRKTALIICVLLGIYGGHQYYVGNIGKGLLYTFTGGLFAIGWIIDIISLATGSFRDKQGRVLVDLNKHYVQFDRQNMYRKDGGGYGQNPYDSGGTSVRRTGQAYGNAGAYMDPEMARLQANERKRKIFFGFMVFGILGILSSMVSGGLDGVVVMVIWTAVFAFLWHRTSKIL